MAELLKKRLRDIDTKYAIAGKPANQTKKAVTLYLDKVNFKKLQKKYGRKASQVIDELIVTLVGKD